MVFKTLQTTKKNAFFVFFTCFCFQAHIKRANFVLAEMSHALYILNFILQACEAADIGMDQAFPKAPHG